MPNRPLIPLVAVSLGLTTAACGGSGAAGIGTGTGPTGNNSPIALSRCMRAHGVPNFPDPRVGPGGSAGLTITQSPGGSSLTVFGITFSGPAFQSARKACKAMLPGGGSPPPPVSAAQRKAMLDNAQCMRTHGVPNFPDPTFPNGGGIRILVGPGVNPQSPAFQNAAKACGGFGQRLSRGPG